MQIERRVFIKKIEGECQYSVLLALCIYMTVSLNVTRVGAMKVADFGLCQKLPVTPILSVGV